ncbi:MAG: hypothetical protein JWM44_4053 [Bacilli bacterium]|nr:hypothetical protein [Bacilli bacterium]
MNDTVILTSTLTVIGGLIVFVIGQIILKYIIEPISDYRKIKSSISITLVYYANSYLNPIEINDDNMKYEALRNERNEVQTKIRKLASELTGSVQVIPFYFLFYLFGIIPSRKKLLEVATNLIGISNSLWENKMYPGDIVETNEERKQRIIQVLKLKQPD